MGGIMFVVGVGALPKDQTLVSEDSTVVPHLPTLDLGGDILGLAEELRATVLIAGLPPIQTKLLEKIQRWEFVDLALLLHDLTSRSDKFLL